jgi:hypothetical protein
MNDNILKINSSPEARLSKTGTALFSLRSKVLRLQTEIPCSCVAQSREKCGLKSMPGRERALAHISQEEFILIVEQKRN